MEPIRSRAIADYLSRLHAGLDDLVSRSESVRAACEAELSTMSVEIARYRQLILDAERESKQEAEFYHGTLANAGLRAANATSKISTAVSARSNQTSGPKTAKSDHLRSAAERILRTGGRPVKRADLTRELQAAGLLANSDNPIDLVRKLLQKSEVIGYDIKTGYFLVEGGH